MSATESKHSTRASARKRMSGAEAVSVLSDNKALGELRRRATLYSDLMTMFRVLSTERLEQLARDIAPEVAARLKELSRPRVVVDNTREPRP